VFVARYTAASTIPLGLPGFSLYVLVLFIQLRFRKLLSHSCGITQVADASLGQNIAMYLSGKDCGKWRYAPDRYWTLSLPKTRIASYPASVIPAFIFSIISSFISFSS